MTPAEMSNYVDAAFKITQVFSIIAVGAMGLRSMAKASAKSEALAEATSKRIEAKLDQQDTIMGDLKTDIQALNKVVTEVAVQTKRLDILSERMNRLERNQDDLRHGHGWVQGQKGIDREYPPITSGGV